MQPFKVPFLVVKSIFDKTSWFLRLSNTNGLKVVHGAQQLYKVYDRKWTVAEQDDVKLKLG
jgi:hypothetical protein